MTNTGTIDTYGVNGTLSALRALIHFVCSGHSTPCGLVEALAFFLHIPLIEKGRYEIYLSGTH